MIKGARWKSANALGRYGGLARHADLRGKIATHEGAAEAATQEFKRLLATANYERTEAVKNALFTKNDALAIANELRGALADSERTALPIQASASRAAERYASTHDAAYARLEACKAVAECEEALTRAMELMVDVPDPSGVDRRADDALAYRMKLLWQHLTTVALERPEAQQQPEVRRWRRLRNLPNLSLTTTCKPYADAAPHAA